MESCEMEEEAKAIGEIAKTAGKAIDGATRAGKFISQYLRGPIGEAFGIIDDKLKYLRWERRVRLMDRATEFMQRRGLTEPTRAVPMSTLVPILQLGSMEEDNSLQDLWARLLVNAADADSGIIVEPAFIGILQNLSSRDAAMLDKIYSVPSTHEKQALYMHELPLKVLTEKPAVEIDPSVDVQLSLGNLNRLGLIDGAMFWGGGPSNRYAYQTVLGRAFMKACRGKSEQG
jgi:hypothetical protein